MKHELIDQRSLAMHRHVAEKVRRDPALFLRVGNLLASWKPNASINSRRYIEKWEELYEAGLEEFLRVALEDSEYGREMRQSSPLTCLLENHERLQFLRDWRLAHETV